MCLDMLRCQRNDPNLRSHMSLVLLLVGDFARGDVLFSTYICYQILHATNTRVISRPVHDRTLQKSHRRHIDGKYSLGA